ncbi:hypothetical protein BP5796_00825 [Coleophoma crateriformis]|uniref:aldehyde dehydrogenase (NAD(+)) n=1 Tax=Coleophoma crateriformis TaxID=565419 RepID=A0A3D8T900_9HELO|nr:hypothetical protein BP5796_00825 [Coleophoma crateriformis]
MAEPIETRLFINGKFVPSTSNGTFDLVSTKTGDHVAKVHDATKEDVDLAVAAAKSAFPSWSSLSPAERGKPLARLAQLVLEAKDELAYLEALSTGRPVSTYFDAYYANTFFDYFAQAAYPHGESSMNTPGYMNLVLRQPFGVVAAITTWNVPVVYLAQRVAPAVAAGNTIVLKSSEKAPLTSAKVAALIAQAGFPPGVINILSGRGECGSAIAHHMDIRVLSFVGSSRIGRAIQRASADSNLKNVIFELGGKSPAIIFKDADLDAAAKDTENSINFLSGQTCFANSRIYVQQSIADAFLAKYKQLAELRVDGDPTDPTINYGPLADGAQSQVVEKYIKLGRETGKELTSVQSRSPEDNFFKPVIFLEQPEDAAVMKEEIFGPVVCINTFETEAEAIAKANDSELGLYAAVYTKDLDRAVRVSTMLEAGMVGVNCTSPTAKGMELPFGGYKGSGIGRVSMLHSMDDFLETKSVFIKVAGI